MLQEVTVAQKEDDIFRRWFEDDFFSIIVFYKLNSDTIHGFQLCYSIYYNEHSLTWISDIGFMHNKIDDGREPMKHPSTPVLVEDGLFQADFILNKFIESCLDIDEYIANFIIGKIIEFGNLSIQLEEINKILKDKKAKLKNEKLEETPNKYASHETIKHEDSPTPNSISHDLFFNRPNRIQKLFSFIINSTKSFSKDFINFISNIFIIPKSNQHHEFKNKSRKFDQDELNDIMKKSELLAKRLSRKRK